jgi:hypothetical protein
VQLPWSNFDPALVVFWSQSILIQLPKPPRLGYFSQ